MTGLDIAKIKEAAKKATPGDWSLEEYQFDKLARTLYASRSGTMHGLNLMRLEDGDWNMVNNCEYIAIANPAAVLALIARLEAAEARVPKRLCVLCGKEAPAHEIPHRGECKECPEAIVDGENYGRLCMFDMTAEEGMNYWRQKAHDAESRASTAYAEGIEAAAKVAEPPHIQADDDYSVGWTNGRRSAASSIRALLKDKPNG